jgi:hypothetical protein
VWEIRAAAAYNFSEGEYKLTHEGEAKFSISLKRMHLHLLKVGSQLCVQQLHLCGCGGNALCVPDTLCFLYCLATAAQVSYGCPDATSIPLVCSAQLSSLSLIGALPKKMHAEAALRRICFVAGPILQTEERKNHSS